MAVKKITTPLTDEVVRDLRAGDAVEITGVIYQARDAAHKRLVALIEAGEALPFELQGAVVYYMGPSPAKPGNPIGSAGPTTSGRMDAYAPLLMKHGLKGMIGKGLRTAEVKQAMVDETAVYFAATGGAGALLAQRITGNEVIAWPGAGRRGGRPPRGRRLPRHRRERLPRRRPLRGGAREVRARGVAARGRATGAAAVRPPPRRASRRLAGSRAARTYNPAHGGAVVTWVGDIGRMLGLGSAAGFRPSLTLAIIAVMSNLGWGTPVNDTFGFLDHWITVVVFVLLAIFESAFDKVPKVDRLQDRLTMPYRLVCGAVAGAALVGHGTTGIVIGVLVGATPRGSPCARSTRSRPRSTSSDAVVPDAEPGRGPARLRRDGADRDVGLGRATSCSRSRSSCTLARQLARSGASTVVCARSGYDRKHERRTRRGGRRRGRLRGRAPRSGWSSTSSSGAACATATCSPPCAPSRATSSCPTTCSTRPTTTARCPSASARRSPSRTWSPT